MLRSSYVYACLLDCSKAFDLVDHSLLFDMLKNRGIDHAYLRLLWYCYKHQRARVEWEGFYSFFFYVQNGVRQGGILSPYLFAIYVDRIARTIQNTCCGCYVNSIYYGVLMYADDIILLCPSLRGLIRMDSANMFASGVNLIFNPRKSVCIRFGAQFFQSGSVKINGIPVRWDNQVRHLGTILSFDMKDNHHVLSVLQDLIQFFIGSNILNLMSCYTCFVRILRVTMVLSLAI
jgi:hypothetical protein